MTEGEKRLYTDTVVRASTDRRYRSQYEALLDIHKIQFHSGIHEIDQFLPWHRWFLLQYENLLRRINCRVTVPYWDWRFWARTPFVAPIWGSEAHHIGGNGTRPGQCVRDGRFRASFWSVPDGSCLSRRFTDGSFPGPVEVAEIMNHGPGNFSFFEVGIRANLHDQAHGWIGGTMNSVDAAYAPEFFLLHGFIDKLWSEWQERSQFHHNAHFSTKTNPMTAAGLISPSHVIDNGRLPGGIGVCYTDSNNELEDVVNRLRSLSSEELVSEFTRRPFLPLDDKSFTVFRLCAKDQAVATAIDKDIRRGCDSSAKPNALASYSHSQALQIERFGFIMEKLY